MLVVATDELIIASYAWLPTSSLSSLTWEILDTNNSPELVLEHEYNQSLQWMQQSFSNLRQVCSRVIVLTVQILTWQLQGVPKKMVIRKGFEFLTLEGVFLGVKKNSKNFGNKKNIRLLSKILSKWTLFCSKSSKFLEFLWISQFQNCKNHLKSQNI